MSISIQEIETILYVSNQEKSCEFYTKLFRQEPSLNVPGMTEFSLSNNFKLGLMPNDGIAKILDGKTKHPSSGNGIPRCELYLKVDHLELEYENALQIGAVEVSPILERDWGDRVCYFSDLDGHIIAFASTINKLT